MDSIKTLRVMLYKFAVFPLNALFAVLVNQLRYALKILPSATVGELLLILNDSLEVIDENWLIDVQSPYVAAIADEQYFH